MIPEHKVPTRQDIKAIVQDWYKDQKPGLEAFVKNRLNKEHPDLAIEFMPNNPKQTYLDKILDDLDSYVVLDFNA